MAGLRGIETTIAGELTADPELRHTGRNGIPVANFTVAYNPRRWNAESGQWENAGTPTFLSCTVWRDMAENVAESLHKGMRVIVTGTLSEERYEGKDGIPRKDFVLTVDEVGTSLRYAVTTAAKPDRQGAAGMVRAVGNSSDVDGALGAAGRYTSS